MFSCLLRFDDLKKRGIVSNRPQLQQMISKYGFPPGRRISPNTRVWTDTEVTAFIETAPTERKTIAPSGRRRGRPRKNPAVAEANAS
jgi:predicted DNA-binding transcriptional regulator AlpA